MCESHKEISTMLCSLSCSYNADARDTGSRKFKRTHRISNWYIRFIIPCGRPILCGKQQTTDQNIQALTRQNQTMRLVWNPLQVS